MPRDREPWIKVKIGLRRSGKVASLPSDAARLGYLYLLLEAKVQRRMGVFDSRAHLAEVLGRFGRYVDGYITAELVHEAPSVCPDCRARNAGLRRGELVVHDYAKEQRDPTHADRQADYRGKVRDGDGDGDGTPPTVPNPVTHGPPDEDVRDGDGDAIGTPDSRARGTTGTGTTTTRDSQGRESENGPAPVAPAGAPLREPSWVSEIEGKVLA